MGDIFADIMSTVGSTPLVRLNAITRGLQATVLAFRERRWVSLPLE